MYRTAITVLSLAISIGCVFAIVIAANWFVQEVATVSVSGQGIPLSAFPKTELDPDKPLFIDRRNGTRRQDCDHVDLPIREE